MSIYNNFTTILTAYLLYIMQVCTLCIIDIYFDPLHSKYIYIYACHLHILLFISSLRIALFSVLSLAVIYYMLPSS